MLGWASPQLSSSPCSVAQAHLSQIASHAGTDTEWVVKDAVLGLLERTLVFAPLRKHKVPPLRFAAVGMTELGRGKASRRLTAELPTSHAQNAPEMGHPASLFANEGTVCAQLNILAQAKLERGTLKTLGWASPLVDCRREFISANSRPLQNRPERGTESFS